VRRVVPRTGVADRGHVRASVGWRRYGRVSPRLRIPQIWHRYRNPFDMIISATRGESYKRRHRRAGMTTFGEDLALGRKDHPCNVAELAVSAPRPG
jgi:hypothetical protein